MIQADKHLDKLSYHEIIETIALGSELPECLTQICEAIEQEMGLEAYSSILLLEGEHLRHGASPRLPPEYTSAIDGVTIGESVGSCGTAAYSKRQVIVRAALCGRTSARLRSNIIYSLAGQHPFSLHRMKY